MNNYMRCFYIYLFFNRHKSTSVSLVLKSSNWQQSHVIDLNDELQYSAVTRFSVPVLVLGLYSGSHHPWEAG